MNAKLKELEDSFQLGPVELASYLGQRSGQFVERYGAELKSIMQRKDLHVSEKEEKLCDMIAMMDRVKVYDLFTREHFKYFVSNCML